VSYACADRRGPRTGPQQRERQLVGGRLNAHVGSERHKLLEAFVLAFDAGPVRTAW
jgi:hypothetical protein